MAEPPRVLVVGVGSIGERHVRCFQAAGAIVSLCETKGDLRRDVSRRYGVPGFATLGEAAEGIDAAVIATPAHLHVPMAIELAERGIHLLIEKPLSVELDQVADLVRLVEERRLTVGVAYVYRAHPALAAMKTAIASRRFGAPLQIVAVCGQHFPHYRPAYREIYYSRRQSGGGAIQDALTHVLNAGQWLVGPVDRLVADADHLALEGVEVEDTVHLLARHDKVLGCYALNQHQAPNEAMIQVVCQQGTARFEFHKHRWRWMTQPDGGWTEETFGPLERDSLFVAQARNFLEAVRGQQQPLCPLEDGVHTLRCNLAALKSSASQSWRSPAEM